VIDISVLRAMASAGASAELIILAVESQIKQETAAEAVLAERRRKETERKRRWRAHRKTVPVVSTGRPRRVHGTHLKVIENVEVFSGTPKHSPHGHTYELSTYSDSKVGTPLKKERKKEERKKEGSAEQVEGRKSIRGCRLPDDWMPSIEDQDAALRIGLTEQQIQVEADKFRDYWHAKAGARATSVKWPATWRNWCRTAKERNGHGYNGQRKGLADIALEMAAEARQRERAQGIGRPDDLFRGA